MPVRYTGGSISAPRSRQARCWPACRTSDSTSSSRGGGRQRAGRAVEVALLTGRGLSWWQEHARETGAMRPWYIQLTLPRDVLHRRIAQRVDEMLAGGLVDELRRILATGVAPHAPGL